MLEKDRVKLLFGPYQSPKCKLGGTLRCRIRGTVKVAGLTDAPILWPYTFRAGGGGRPLLILCGDLVRAVRRESETAIVHWWGVCITTVWKWRKILGVAWQNDGTKDLFRRYTPEKFDDEVVRKRMEALKNPERSAKIAAAKRGKPRPAHVIEALRKANTGRKHTEEARRNMSEAQKKRGYLPPGMQGPLWTDEEEALLGTMPDKDVAARIGRSAKGVASHRERLGIRSFYKRKPRRRTALWTPEKDALLGTMSDIDLARKLRFSAMAVFYRRRSLGIGKFRGG